MKLTKQQWIRFGVAFFLGALWLFAIRFVLLTRDSVHYHANFAVYVDGERLPFEKFTFYEEVQSCGGDNENNPKIRVHMHDQISHVVHVHDEASTWGHFFANLGYANGDTVFKTDEAVYVEDDQTEIRFILNGDEVQTTANRTIGDEDVLLVSIGQPTEEELAAQYDNIMQDAASYNDQADPSACAGDGGPLSLSERFLGALGIPQ